MGSKSGPVSSLSSSSLPTSSSSSSASSASSCISSSASSKDKHSNSSNKHTSPSSSSSILLRQSPSPPTTHKTNHSGSSSFCIEALLSRAEPIRRETREVSRERSYSPESDGDSNESHGPTHSASSTSSLVSTSRGENDLSKVRLLSSIHRNSSATYVPTSSASTGEMSNGMDETSTSMRAVFPCSAAAALMVNQMSVAGLPWPPSQPPPPFLGWMRSHTLSPPIMSKYT